MDFKQKDPDDLVNRPTLKADNVTDEVLSKLLMKFFPSLLSSLI
jgi:hypothetical protein